MSRIDSACHVSCPQHREPRGARMSSATEVQALQRKNASEVLRALAAITQARAAEIAQISETKLSRILSPQAANEASELDRFCALLSACNLMLVPRSWSSIDPDELRATRLLARKALDLHTRDSGWEG